MLKTKSQVRPGGPQWGHGPSGGDSNIFEHIIEQIHDHGYVVLDGALADNLLNGLFLHFTTLDREAFKQAGIGRQQDFHLNDFTRRDQIHWLSPGAVEVQGYFDWIEQLRLYINRNLFLGLFDYECHYAHYPEGGFYKKHVDAFRGTSNRRLSTILYLNPQWQPGDGGELAMYRERENDPFLRIAPQYGRMVIFLSEVFPHEVLRANRARFSLTGWYRVNGSTAEVLDPPLIT
ncbi:2OG-Fe(II) oxygenase [Proteobacteria bacterium 005FR1]|nr:2OG-Fe(II) oxygenase [Proteobacteria bacterium 005FR1]